MPIYTPMIPPIVLFSKLIVMFQIQILIQRRVPKIPAVQVKVQVQMTRQTVQVLCRLNVHVILQIQHQTCQGVMMICLKVQLLTRKCSMLLMMYVQCLRALPTMQI